LVTFITRRALTVCYHSSLDGNVRKNIHRGDFLARALRNHNVWLALTYVGLILLMARTYA